jgi:hypothetical protein
VRTALEMVLATAMARKPTAMTIPASATGTTTAVVALVRVMMESTRTGTKANARTCGERPSRDGAQA